MKTGAHLDSDQAFGNTQQRQGLGLPARNSQVKGTEGTEAGGFARDDKAMAEATHRTGRETTQDAGYETPKSDGELSSLASGAVDSSDDEDFLDLLVDTLDGEFDPALLIGVGV